MFQYSRGQIRRAFAAQGATTKEQIAAALASQFPELARRLPPKRKVWMSEDHRMAIFDAVALIFTGLHEELG